MMLVSIILGMSSGAVFEIHPLHGLFVAACLTLSSTPLVARFLESMLDLVFAIYVCSLQCIWLIYCMW